MHLEDDLRALYYRLTDTLSALARDGRGYDRLSIPLAWLRRVEKRFGGPGGAQAYKCHLRRVFPDRTERWRRRTLAGYWRNHQRRILSLYRTALLTREGLDDAVEWSGLDAFREAADSGEGVLLLVPHYGDERTLHILLGMAGLDVHVLTSRYADAPSLIRERRLMVSRRWNSLHFPEESPAWMLKVLNSGGIVHFAPTSWGGVRGQWLEAFGVPVLTTTVHRRLHQRTGCRVFLGWNSILPGMRYSVDLEAFGPPTGRDSFNRLLFERIEARARRQPRQYDWMNLIIRHRETNTMVRLGGVPRRERVLEESALPIDWDANLAAELEEVEALPPLGNDTGGSPVSI